MNRLKNFYIKPDSISKNILSDDSLFLNFPQSNISQNINDWSETFKKNHLQTLPNEINSLGFRSEEFKANHEGLHVLFLGCSYTWGTGLPLDQVWSKKIYEKIKNQQNVSGFFNLGIPGDSVYSSIINAFKYFKNFGNPDVIFFNVQDITRFYAYNKENKNFYRSNISENNILQLLAYQYYYMLEQYCYSNNIILISFTWYLGHEEHILNKFKSFNHPRIKEVSDFVFKYNNLFPESLIAQDGHHLGSAYHEYWAKYAYEIYSKRDIINNR